MNLTAIFSNNIIAIIIMLIVLLSLKQYKRLGLLDEQLFTIVVVTSIIASIVEMLSFAFDGRTYSGAYMLNRLANSILYITDTFPLLAWVAYVDYKIFNDKERLKKILPKLAIPACIVCVLSILSIYFDVLFQVDSNNIYMRKPAIIIPTLSAAFYLLYGTILVFVNKKNIHRYWFMPIINFSLPVFVAMLVQMSIYGLSLVWVGAAISIIIIYINVQNEQSCIDGLTGLYNRIHMDYYLSNECGKIAKDTVFAGVMMDVDSFKNINDSYGHAVGDEALRNVGKILHTCTRYTDFAARYGGDEFVIFLKVKNETEILDFMEKVKKSVDTFNLLSSDNQYTLSLSMGYSVYNNGDDTVDGLLNRMDSAMYFIKNAKKQQIDM